MTKLMFFVVCVYHSTLLTSNNTMSDVEIKQQELIQIILLNNADQTHITKEKKTNIL